MKRAKRILLIASMLVLSVGSAPASWWHRSPKKPAPQAAPAAAPTTMTLNAIEAAPSQIVLHTSGAPAFTSLSPTPDQFVIDLSGTTKAAGLTLPSTLPPGVSAINADEVTEMGSKLTRVTVKLAHPGMAQAAASGDSVVVSLPAAAVVETPAPAMDSIPRVTTATVETAAVKTEPAPVKSQSVSLPKAKVLKKIETAGSGSATEVRIATDGDASYSVFKLESPFRVVIDLPGLKNKLAKNSIAVQDSIVKQIRVGQFSKDVTRVVLDLSEKSAYNVSRSGDRLVVTFGQATAAVPAAPPAVKVAEVTKPAAEPVKAPATDVVSQVPAVAENATTWKMPADASQGAVGVIRGEDQAQPPAPAPRTTRSQTLTPAPAGTATTTTENVFSEPQAQGAPMVGGQLGTRTLSAGERVYTGEPISLNLKDADLKDVLRTFADLTGLNMAIDPNVTGSVTVDFVDVPWDQALDIILRQNNLTYKLEGNVMRVGTITRLSEEEAANRKLQEEERLNVPLTTVTFKLSYARANDVQTLLREIASPRARMIVDQRTNQLIISEIPAYLQTIRNLIESVDVPNRQVVIEARIVETAQTFIQQWGINWGFRGMLDPSLGTGTGLIFPNRVDVIGGPFDFATAAPVLTFSLSNVLGTFTLDVALTALETTSLGRVIAAPRVQTQDNVAAQISAGTQIPFQTRINFTTTVSYINATLDLSVTPQITEAGTVIMDIAVQKNDPLTTEPGAPGPSIQTRSARTKLMVRDGGTAVIAGVYQVNDSENHKRLPFVHEIPIIGNLFKNRSVNQQHSELIIFITPRIVRNS